MSRVKCTRSKRLRQATSSKYPLPKSRTWSGCTTSMAGRGQAPPELAGPGSKAEVWSSARSGSGRGPSLLLRVEGEIQPHAVAQRYAVDVEVVRVPGRGGERVPLDRPHPEA